MKTNYAIQLLFLHTEQTYYNNFSFFNKSTPSLAPYNFNSHWGMWTPVYLQSLQSWRHRFKELRQE